MINLNDGDSPAPAASPPQPSSDPFEPEDHPHRHIGVKQYPDSPGAVAGGIARVVGGGGDGIPDDDVSGTASYTEGDNSAALHGIQDSRPNRLYIDTDTPDTGSSLSKNPAIQWVIVLLVIGIIVLVTRHFFDSWATWGMAMGFILLMLMPRHYWWRRYYYDDPYYDDYGSSGCFSPYMFW